MASVTIASGTVNNWQLGSDVQLRVYPLESFLAADSSYEAQGTPSEDATQNDNFYIAVACMVSGSVLTIASCTLESTTDSLTNPAAQYGAYFFTTEGQRIGAFGAFSAFSLPASPTSTTWAAIAEAQGGTL
jgi:hypothetical protein